MSTGTTVVLVLALGSYLLKSAGPLWLGADRVLPSWVGRTALLLPAPLLAAMVATSTFSDGSSLRFDARVAGLVTAFVALRLRAPFVVVVVAAAAATALVRLV